MNTLIACMLLLVVRLARGYPVSSAAEQPKYPMKLTDTARTVQSVSHMAVVEVMAPLYTALYSLETNWFDLLAIASEREIHIPSFDKPKVGLDDVFSCEAKSSPKYSAALKFIMDNEKVIDYRVKNATALANGIRFVSKLMVNDNCNEEILVAATKKLEQFLVDYSRVLQGIKSAVCADVKMVMEESRPNSAEDAPLSEFENYFSANSNDPSSAAVADRYYAVARDTDSAHLIGKDTDSAHLIDKNTDSAHLIGKDTDSAHLIGKDTDSAHLIGKDTDSAHLIGKDTDSAHLIGKDTDSAHLIGKDTDSAHLIGKDTDSAHLIGKDTDSAHLIGRDTDSAHLIDRDTDSAHLIGKDTDSAHLIGKDTDSAHLIGRDTDNAHLIG